jgi:AcrR family transcriptional regulator
MAANPLRRTRRKPGPPAATRRERRSAELRERLFRAALSLFGSKGYAETTVEDITEAADVGKGTFFNYFPSKEHILLAFGEMQLRKLEGIIRDSRESRQSTGEIMHGLIARMTEAPIRNPAIVRALLQAHLSSPLVREEMLKIQTRHRYLLGQLLRYGQERGEVRTDLPAEELAQLLRQTIFGTLLLWSLAGDASLPGRIEQALRIFWEGIAAGPRGQATAKERGRRKA